MPQQAQVEKTVDGVETHWLSGKETVPGATFCKEGHADSFPGQETIHHNWLAWKVLPLAKS